MKGSLLQLGCMVFLVFGCKENNQPVVTAQDQLNVAPGVPPASQIPSAKEPTTTKYKSYPQVLRTLFSEYSYMDEIRNILGKPEHIQNVDAKTQVWFYGNGEIMFKGRFAVEVKNEQLFKAYRTIHQLVESDDYNELRFGRELLHRATQTSTQIETH